MCAQLLSEKSPGSRPPKQFWPEPSLGQVAITDAVRKRQFDRAPRLPHGLVGISVQSE